MPADLELALRDIARRHGAARLDRWLKKIDKRCMSNVVHLATRGHQKYIAIHADFVAIGKARLYPVPAWLPEMIRSEQIAQTRTYVARRFGELQGELQSLLCEWQALPSSPAAADVFRDSVQALSGALRAVSGTISISSEAARILDDPPQQ